MFNGYFCARGWKTTPGSSSVFCTWGLSADYCVPIILIDRWRLIIVRSQEPYRILNEKTSCIKWLHVKSHQHPSNCYISICRTVINYAVMMPQGFPSRRSAYWIDKALDTINVHSTGMLSYSKVWRSCTEILQHA